MTLCTHIHDWCIPNHGKKIRVLINRCQSTIHKHRMMSPDLKTKPYPIICFLFNFKIGSIKENRKTNNDLHMLKGQISLSRIKFGMHLGGTHHVNKELAPWGNRISACYGEAETLRLWARESKAGNRHKTLAIQISWVKTAIHTVNQLWVIISWSLLQPTRPKYYSNLAIKLVSHHWQHIQYINALTRFFLFLSCSEHFLLTCCYSYVVK